MWNSTEKLCQLLTITGTWQGALVYFYVWKGHEKSPDVERIINLHDFLSTHISPSDR